MKCKHCGETVSRKPKIYCNNVCQQAFHNAGRIEVWLRTGVVNIKSDPNHFVKKHIFSEQDGKCDLCNSENVWMGQPLSLLTLDHIDGNSEDNSRTNLRLIYPNCDSQLDTFKARNKGKGRKAIRERNATVALLHHSVC